MSHDLYSYPHPGEFYSIIMEVMGTGALDSKLKSGMDDECGNISGGNNSTSLGNLASF